MSEGAFLFWLHAIAALAAVLSAASFIPYLTSSLVWDDPLFFKRAIQAPWLAAFSPFDLSVNFWRPLSTASLTLPWAFSDWLGGSGPATLVSKWASVLLFAATAAASCMACFAGHVEGRLPKGRSLLAVSLLGLFFCVAPFFSEQVLWLSDRGDVLVCLLLSITLLVAFSRPDHPGFLPFLLGLCMGFSKEAGIMWCFLLGFFCLRNDKLSKWSLGFMAAGLSNLLIWKIVVVASLHPVQIEARRLSLGSASLHQGPRAPFEFSMAFLESVGRAGYATFAHWSDACAVHPEQAGSLACKIAGVAILAAFAAASWIFYKKIKSTTDSRSALASSYALSAMAMIVIFSIYSVYSVSPGESWAFSIVKDRYISPSLLVLAVLGARHAMLSPRRASRWFLAGMAAFILLCLPSTHPSRKHWMDDESLWTPCVEHSAPFIMAYSNLAAELFRQGKVGDARDLAVKSMALMPSVPACTAWAVIEASGENDPAILGQIMRLRAQSPTCEDIEDLPIPSRAGQSAHGDPKPPAY